MAEWKDRWRKVKKAVKAREVIAQHYYATSMKVVFGLLRKKLLQVGAVGAKVGLKCAKKRTYFQIKENKLARARYGWGMFEKTTGGRRLAVRSDIAAARRLFSMGRFAPFAPPRSDTTHERVERLLRPAIFPACEIPAENRKI